MSNPTQAQLTAAGMALIPNLFEIIESNGKKVRSWDDTTKKFVVVTGTITLNENLYATPNSWVIPTQIDASSGSLASSPIAATTI